MSLHSRSRRGVLLAALLTPFGGVAQSVPSAAPVAAPVPVLRVFALPGYQVRAFQKAPGGELIFEPGSEGLAEMVLASDISGPCSSTLSMGVSGVSAYEGRAAASWVVKVSLVSTEGDRATVDVRWQRTVHRAGLLREGDATVETRLTLQDGASGILDVVRAAPGAEGVCASFAVGIELGFRSWATEVRDAGIGYDIWLVDRDRQQPARPIRTRASAWHDERAAYVFPPVRLTGSQGEVTFTAQGTVTGRVRTDGTIDLLVDTSQGYAGASSGVSGGGRKRLVVTPGETVELELPEVLRARLPADLRQHAFGLRVTAERLW